LTKNKIIILFPILSLLLSCSNYYKKKYLENTTKIKLPKSNKNIQIFDNNFFATIGKFLIKDKIEINNFIINYKFKKLEKNKKSIIESDGFLYKENQVILNDNDFFYISEKTEEYRWNILINKTTGELWIEVLCPGFSGNKS